MKAILKNYRQSPRKVRLLADLVRGKSVKKALEMLTFVNKRASEPFSKLIRSASANAKTQGIDVDSLTIKVASVNKGTVLKRMMPRARGSSAPINKRNSHIAIELASQSSKKEKVKAKKQKVSVA